MKPFVPNPGTNLCFEFEAQQAESTSSTESMLEDIRIQAESSCAEAQIITCRHVCVRLIPSQRAPHNSPSVDQQRVTLHPLLRNKSHAAYLTLGSAMRHTPNISPEISIASGQLRWERERGENFKKRISWIGIAAKKEQGRLAQKTPACTCKHLVSIQFM